MNTSLFFKTSRIDELHRIRQGTFIKKVNKVNFDFLSFL